MIFRFYFYFYLVLFLKSKNFEKWKKKQPFNYNNWVVEFEYKVGGQGSKVYGDGFAFWLTKERAQTGIFKDYFIGLEIKE